ncbi:hypothetical protein A3Q56_07711 [Intoshia linei]|uniref:Disintegrin domain-containing protein n=1 Tax=Intoshia linei TaxID=1819745 RepID=A0A177ARB6_9BILA|nr:hypothetical protein A3Q56_07711 [Intoshia linei]
MLLGDKCCNPSTCFFFEGKVCSPTNNVCCDTDCTFIPKVKNKICREESQCQYSSICGYPFYFNYNFCIVICQKTICQLLNQIDCDSDPNDLDYESLCYLSCQENKNGKCINYRNSPEFVLNSIRNIINVSSFTTDFRREKHSKCFLKNNKLGYCDFKLKCRPFDPDSPFQPLYDFFNGDYLEDNIKIILTRYWWAVVLGSMSIILFMGLIVHCFAIYTPTNNPNAQPAKSIKHSFYNVGNTIKRMSIVNNPNPRQFQLAHMSNRK